MSGTFPATPVPRSVAVTSQAPAFVVQPRNLYRRIVRTRGAHRWTFHLEYPSTTERTDIAPLLGFLLKQRGRYEAFTFVLPQHGPLGVATGSPVVAATPVSGGRLLYTSGWTASQAGILTAGSYLKLENDSKVYILTADANSDGAGAATLSIEPALYTTPAASDTITINNVPFRCALAGDTLTHDVNNALLYGFAVDLVEVA